VATEIEEILVPSPHAKVGSTSSSLAAPGLL
jgi:hypothetical protein